MSASAFAGAPAGEGFHQGPGAEETFGVDRRELLPCPIPFQELHRVDSRGASRSVVRRLQKANHWKLWCNDGMVALNELYGHGGEADVTVSKGQRACLDRIVTILVQMCHPREPSLSSAAVDPGTVVPCPTPSAPCLLS